MIKAKRAWAFSGIVAALMVMAACGSGTTNGDCVEDQDGTLVPVPCPTSVATSEPTPAPTPPTPITPTPTQPCEPVLTISVDGNALQFDKGTFTAKAGCKVGLEFDNVSTFNQHNWVLVKAGTKDEVAGRGLGEGPDNNYVQPGDPDVIAHTPLVDPGKTDKVEFTVPEAGAYQFVCTFPAHNFTMFGDFVVIQ